jgi:hypothetical protein
MVKKTHSMRHRIECYLKTIKKKFQLLEQGEAHNLKPQNQDARFERQ